MREGGKEEKEGDEHRSWDVREMEEEKKRKRKDRTEREVKGGVKEARAKEHQRQMKECCECILSFEFFSSPLS